MKLTRLAVFAAVATPLAGLALQRARGPALAVVTVARREIVQRVVASGRVLPPARVNLGAVVLGVAARVDAVEGQQVKARQVLVQLDDAEAQAQVAQARAQVELQLARLEQIRTTGSTVAKQGLRQAEVTLSHARQELERSEQLRQSGAGTAEQVERATKAWELAQSQAASAAAQVTSTAADGSERRQAEASLAQARALLVGAQARLAQTTVVASVDGVILSRAVEPGDIVQPGRTLFVLARRGETLLGAQPEEKNLGLLAPGQPALASADAFPEQTFPALVSYVAPSVDPQRGTVEVKLKVATPPPYLRPDMTVSLNVEVARRPRALALPVEALRPGDGGPSVLLLRDGRLAAQPVRLGLRGDQLVEVTGGLAEGDEVVAAPTADLAPGQRARARR